MKNKKCLKGRGKKVTAIFFFHQGNTATQPQEGFSLELRGLFELDLLLIEMHRPNITTPYNSILGTDGRVIWEDTFSNPQSSHVLRHSGMSEREERRLQTPMTLQALQCIHTNFAHAHTHAQRFIREAFATVGSGANWFHARLKNEIKNNRKV